MRVFCSQSGVTDVVPTAVRRSVMTLRLPKRGSVFTRLVRSGVSKHCARTLDECWPELHACSCMSAK